ncbi:hypothetical protein Q604_UNBC07297G0001, partial [human gut metagenome]
MPGTANATIGNAALPIYTDKEELILS